MRDVRVRLRLAAALAWVCGTAALAQAPASTPLAQQLVSAMGAVNLDSIAARDPKDPTRAIAALAFPGSQLLVVSAPYPDAAELDSKLRNQLYRDVYTALQQPSFAKGKVFFQDMGADGLKAGTDGTVDVMYEEGKTQTIFDGNWRKQKLSESEYRQRAKDADERYAHLLSALIDAAKKK